MLNGWLRRISVEVLKVLNVHDIKGVELGIRPIRDRVFAVDSTLMHRRCMMHFEVRLKSERRIIKCF